MASRSPSAPLHAQVRGSGILVRLREYLFVESLFSKATMDSNKNMGGDFTGPTTIKETPSCFQEGAVLLFRKILYVLSRLRERMNSYALFRPSIKGGMSLAKSDWDFCHSLASSL